MTHPGATERVHSELTGWSHHGRESDTSVSYLARMERVWLWLRMLGTTGAVANARSLADQHERERSIVDSLLTRLAISDPEATAA